MEYCRVTAQDWCEIETNSFAKSLNTFKSFSVATATDEEIVEQMTDMAHFANIQAEKSHKIWVEMNDGAFVIAMTIGVWTMIFNLAINFSGL